MSVSKLVRATKKKRVSSLVFLQNSSANSIFVVKYHSYEYETQRQDTREELKAIEAPPAEGESEFVETVTRKVIENPTDADYEQYKASDNVEIVHGGGEHHDHHDHHEHGSHHGSDHDEVVFHGHRSKSKRGSRSPSPSRDFNRSRSKRRSKSHARSKSRHHRSKSRRRSRRGSVDFYEKRVEYDSDSDRGKGRLELVMPERGHRKDRKIKDEIKALEAERRALKHDRYNEDRRRRLERHHDHSSSDDDRDVVRIEKDRRGRLNLVKSD